MSAASATSCMPMVMMMTSRKCFVFVPPKSFLTINNNNKKKTISVVPRASGDSESGDSDSADQTTKKYKKRSILCSDCEGNGAVQCSQCEGTGLNSVDHFNGRFKAGALCWLCRGKKEILCGNCNGAGFLGGFMSTHDS